MITDEVNMNRETALWIMAKEWGMRKLCAQMVPRATAGCAVECLCLSAGSAYLLEVLICWKCLSAGSAYLLEQLEGYPELLDRGEESWLFQYDPETRHQSLEWSSEGSPRPNEARMSKLEVKYMLVCFFDSMGIVHKECVPAGQAVNQYYYTEIPKRLRKRVKWVCRNTGQNWILYHDNVPAHAALAVAQFLTSEMHNGNAAAFLIT
jgi:hypothetical protein